MRDLAKEEGDDACRDAWEVRCTKLENDCEAVEKNVFMLEKRWEIEDKLAYWNNEATTSEGIVYLMALYEMAYPEECESRLLFHAFPREDHLVSSYFDAQSHFKTSEEDTAYYVRRGDLDIVEAIKPGFSLEDWKQTSLSDSIIDNLLTRSVSEREEDESSGNPYGYTTEDYEIGEEHMEKKKREVLMLESENGEYE